MQDCQGKFQEIRPGLRRIIDAVVEKIRLGVRAAKWERFSNIVGDLRPFLLVLSNMLQTAVDARHGGTFIFLPSNACDASKYGISLLYRTSDLDDPR